MKNNGMHLSVVLPCYLEAENLRLLLPRLKGTLKGLGCPHEIIIIDTMTPLDDTRDICKKEKVLYFNRENSNSYGDAIRTGIQKARGAYILFMDADGSHTPEFIPSMFGHRNNHDVVIASRYVSGGFTDNNRALVAMSKVLNIIYSKALNIRYRDISNSFKLYRADLLKSIPLECDNFDIVEEILYKLDRANPGLKVIEIPYSFKKRMFGETKRNLAAFILTFAMTLVKLVVGKLNFILMLKYFLVALAGLVVDYGIYIFLLKIAGVHYLVAGFISFCFGFLVNFFAGRKFVFTKGSVFKNSKSEFTAILVIQLMAIAFHQLALYASVEWFSIPPLYAKLFALAATFIWNFIGRRLVYHTGK